MPTAHQCIEQLTEISCHATATYYESRLANYIASKAKDLGLEWESDEVGNILVHYVGPSSDDKDCIVYVAHMDHPAFEVVDAGCRTGRLLGNVDAKCFDSPVPVLIYPRRRTRANTQRHGPRTGETA